MPSSASSREVSHSRPCATQTRGRVLYQRMHAHERRPAATAAAALCPSRVLGATASREVPKRRGPPTGASAIARALHACRMHAPHRDATHAAHTHVDCHVAQGLLAQGCLDLLQPRLRTTRRTWALSKGAGRLLRGCSTSPEKPLPTCSVGIFSASTAFRSVLVLMYRMPVPRAAAAWGRLHESRASAPPAAESIVTGRG